MLATILKIEIRLEGTDPPIWRTLSIPAAYKLGKVHEILQIAMGWFNYHYHMFEISGKEYASSSYELEDPISDLKLTLGGAFGKAPSGFRYVYDFGDGWRHRISLLERFKANESYPSCIGGRGACPPEDVGGVGGFGNFLRAVQDAHHEEHARMLEWVGGWFDPDSFNPIHTTAALIGWWQQQT